MTDLRSLINVAIAENDSLLIRVRDFGQNEVECKVQPRGWDESERFFGYSYSDNEYRTFELSSIVRCTRVSSGMTWQAQRIADVVRPAESVAPSDVASGANSASQDVGVRQQPASAETGPGRTSVGPVHSSGSVARRHLRNSGPLQILVIVMIVLALYFLITKSAPLDVQLESNASPTAFPESAPIAVATLRTSLCSAQHVKCFEFEYGTVRMFHLQDSKFKVRKAPALDAVVVTATNLDGVSELIARNAAGAWLQVRMLDGRSGWIFAPDVAADGDIDRLPIVEIPPIAAEKVNELEFIDATPTEPSPAATNLVRRQIATATPEDTATPENIDSDVQTSEDEPSVELDETVVSRILATQGASDGAGEASDLESGVDPAPVTIEPTELPTSAPPEATSTATPLPAARNCPRPEVCILAPPSGVYRRYTDVYFIGTATHPNFQRYKFEAVNRASGQVGTVAEFWKPVPRGELMRFATFSMPPGRYTFRMIVIDNTGNSWPEIAEVDIELQ